MRNVFLNSRLAILAAVFLVLGATAACNDFDDPEDAEVVVLVTAQGPATGTSVAAPENVEVKLTVSLEDRSGLAGSFFNSVTFSDYTVTFAANPPPNEVGVIGTTFCGVGSTCELTLALIRATNKAGAGAGPHTASVFVEGHDVNGNAVAFNASLTPFAIVP